MKSRKLAISVAMLLFVTSEAAFAANTQMTITVTNSTTATISPSGANIAGTVFPALVAIPASQSKTYVNTGIGNATAFHVNYGATPGKQCHYDAASYSTINAFGSSYCIVTKAAQSVGSTSATCTATVTSESLDPTNCAFSVTFGIH